VSTVLERPLPETAADREAEQRWSKSRRLRPGPRLTEDLTLLGVAGGAYFALGVWLLRSEHILVFDGLARLSHAFFVFWNSPPKLTAIGFVWPPVETLVFLPFALIRPLATSLLALPLMSAFCGGLLLLVLNRLFELGGMRPWQRYPLLLVFGANPMIAFYAANGMAEIVYLFLLVGGIYSFVRWYLTRAAGPLVSASMFFSLGILTRYEVFSWALLLVVPITLVSIRQRVHRSELEGTLLTYLAPIAYSMGLWLFFNWLIEGSPLFWLRQQAPGAPLSPGAAAPHVASTTLSPLRIAEKLVALNWELFPPVVIAVIVLLAVALVRKDWMTWTLIAMLLVNAAFTWLIVVGSGSVEYFQLRYNMRAMPIAVASIAWLYLLARGRRRHLVWAASLLSLAVAIPFTLHTMRVYPYQFREQAFVNAVEGKGGLPDPLVGARKVASWVDAQVHQRDAILTDDSQTFAVMLLSGRPDLFLDRIDHGDARWLAVRDNPWGTVRYMLMITGGPDLIAAKYPKAGEGANPGLTPVFRSQNYILLRVAAKPPAAR